MNFPDEEEEEFKAWLAVIVAGLLIVLGSIYAYLFRFGTY